MDGVERKTITRWYPRGAYICYREWNGANPEKPAEGLRMRNEDMREGILERSPAAEEKNLITLTDSLPFQDRGGVTIAETFANNGKGVVLTKGDTSRIPGWSQLRSRLIGVEIDSNDNKRHPMMYICSSCRALRDYIPALERHKSKLEDAAESGEATHACDSARLAAMAREYIQDRKEENIDTANLSNKMTFDMAVKVIQKNKVKKNDRW